MDKKKFVEIKKKVQNDVEDAIVKTNEFIHKHPALSAFGGMAIGAVASGVIGYFKGKNEGINIGKELEWQKTQDDFDAGYTDTVLLDHVDKDGFSDNALSRIMAGAAYMHLEPGKMVKVFRSDSGDGTVPDLYVNAVQYDVDLQDLKEGWYDSVEDYMKTK